MIDYNPKTWFSLVFDVYSRHVLKVLLPLLLFIGLFSTTFVFIIHDVLRYHYSGTITIHSILGIILGLFLVFRTNTAYDRWWEGRKLWGQLVNDTRMLAIKLNNFLPADDKEDRLFFQQMIANLTYSLKEHLRDSRKIGEEEYEDLDLREAVIKATHRPNKIVNTLYQQVVTLKRKAIISHEQLIILDKELKSFSDIIGACERIKSTPIPYSYSMFIKKFVFIFSITLPVSFVWEFHYWTVPIVMVVFYFLVSVELISEEIEDPFGGDINDLPLQQLCDKIKANVIEIFE
jgi:putative membrane protein